MNQEEWHTWCQDVTQKLGNLEKTLLTYHRIQKRMLYVILTGMVLSSGLLLFY
jgi:hypothetical protein